MSTSPSRAPDQQHPPRLAWALCVVLTTLAVSVLGLQLVQHGAARSELPTALIALLLLSALLVLARVVRQSAGAAAARPGADGAVAAGQPLAQPLTQPLAVPFERAAVLQRLQQALAHTARHAGYGFAVLSLDVDAPGTGATDDGLQAQITQRLQQALRPGDLSAALAPDEAAVQPGAAGPVSRCWVAVLDGVSSAQRLAAVAERVLAALAEPYLIGCTPHRCGVSIGAVLHPGATAPGEPTPDEEALLRNAGTARGQARRGGAGRWVLFDDSMQERVERARVLQAELRQALDKDELLLLYQPVVALCSGALVAVQALVRWRHPERGLLMPADFMAAAEEAGLIDALGDAVLQQACTQYMRWRVELGVHAPPLLAIKLSRSQLRNGALVAALAERLQRCGMRPEWLQLDVPESLAAQDDPAQAMLRALKALGLRLALDDFGSGQSSLARLRQLPVDTVKIDRSFVGRAQTVEHHRVLIEATTRVARTLGMATVAQGVDTAAQAALMQALQCDRGQGGWYGVPMQAAALSAWLAAHRAQPA